MSCGMWSIQYRVWGIWDGLRAMGYEVYGTGYGVWGMGYGAWGMGHVAWEAWVWDMGYGLFLGYGLLLGYGLWAMGCAVSSITRVP